MLLAILLSACGGDGGTTEPTCEEVEAAAGEIVRAVLDGPQPCVVAEDCEVVAVNGSCFDNCSRVIAVDSRDAFEAALLDAEGEACVDYGGCTLIIPPCAPPEPASCGDAGQCQGG